MKYRFYQDEKHTVWYRTIVEVEAEDYQEALQKLGDSKDNPISEECDGVIVDSFWIHDTYEPLTPSDNGGYSTLETYNDKDELIYDNSTL